MNKPQGIAIQPLPPAMLRAMADKLGGMVKGYWHRDDQEFVHALSRLEIMLRWEAKVRREDGDE